MEKTTPTNFHNLWSENRDLQNKAFFQVLELTNSRIDWAYEVWDELVRQLNHADNHNRAIAAQVLCNLAKSDTEKKMLADFNALFAVTRDDRFVTARHCMQALWKVGAAGSEQQALLISALENRFKECVTEKNCTLIRYDIIQSLRNLYHAVKDETVKAKALELIVIEEDIKYRRKYASLWKSR